MGHAASVHFPGLESQDQQRSLKALMDSISQKDKMLPNKTVLQIDQTNSGVSANCEGGYSYNGDVSLAAMVSTARRRLVVGCAVFLVRRIVDDFRVMKKTTMHAEFNCLFGISDPVDGLIEGTVDTLFDKGKPMLVTTDNHRRGF